jgi:Family of unknown function (DUF6299)
VRRFTFVLATTLTLFTAAAAPAYAAAPGNDGFAGAVEITAVPFDVRLDTGEATTDADDTEANAQCGAPATEASVWYSYTPATDGAILLDMQGSSYSGGFLVVTGSPGSFSLVDCGPGAVGVPVSAGVTYHILVVDDQLDGDGQNGGTLTFTVQTAPPPPVVDVALNATGVHNKDGSATISGTLSCTGQVEFSLLQAEVSQRVGRGVVAGFAGMQTHCDGVSRPWSLTVFPAFGTKFAGGKAATVALTVACGQIFCAIDYEQRTIQLSRK